MKKGSSFILFGMLMHIFSFTNAEAKFNADIHCDYRAQQSANQTKTTNYIGTKGFAVLQANAFHGLSSINWRHRKRWKITTFEQSRSRKWKPSMKPTLRHKTPVTVIDKIENGFTSTLLVVQTKRGTRKIISSDNFSPRAYWKCGFNSLGAQDVVLAKLVGGTKKISGIDMLGESVSLPRGTIVRCDGQKEVEEYVGGLLRSRDTKPNEVHCVANLRNGPQKGTISIFFESQNLKQFF